jgi:hypothetical protein
MKSNTWLPTVSGMNNSFSVARPAEVPMPAVVAARPSDARGYLVPAVTPWPDGRPEFARQSTPRTLVCLAERAGAWYAGPKCLPGLSTVPSTVRQPN